jgi:hypothetical protein
MSLFKYFGEQDDRHHGRLFWSNALDGLPIRGASSFLLKSDEVDSFVDIHWDFHCKEFDLFNEKDLEEYTYVMDRIVNGWFYLHHRDYIREPQSNRVRYVYLEWSQRYGQVSPLHKNRFINYDEL